MIAQDLISNLIKEIKLSDSCDYAMEWMTDNQLLHLPVIENGKFLGIVSEEAILNLVDTSQTIEESKIQLHQNFVWANTHIYDVVRITANSRLTVIPVIDKKVNYLGVITIHDIYANLAKLSSMTDLGGILVLEVDNRDFVLSEISRIVESCNAIILSCFTNANTQANKIEITLKINLSDLSEVVETLERFDYTISQSYYESDSRSNLEDRYDSLMKYLNT